MKTFYTLLLFYLCVQPVFSQQDSLLEKYRAMALDYNHDLRAADKNIASSMELIKSRQSRFKAQAVGRRKLPVHRKSHRTYREPAPKQSSHFRRA